MVLFLVAPCPVYIMIRWKLKHLQIHFKFVVAFFVYHSLLIKAKTPPDSFHTHYKHVVSISVVLTYNACGRSGRDYMYIALCLNQKMGVHIH